LNNVAHANVVLNTPFCVVRTMSKQSIKKVNFVSEEIVDKKIKPFKQYHPEDSEMKKMNVVVFIMESFAREYSGAFNTKIESDTSQSYTHFLYLLYLLSLILYYAFSNSMTSIYSMPVDLYGF